MTLFVPDDIMSYRTRGVNSVFDKGVPEEEDKFSTGQRNCKNQKKKSF